MYILTQCFDEVYIIKPKHSRIVNSERYAVAKGYEGDAGCKAAVEALTKAHAACTGEGKHESTPLSAVPVEMFKTDAFFMKCLKEANTTLAKSQTEALEKVCARVDQLAQEKERMLQKRREAERAKQALLKAQKEGHPAATPPKKPRAA